MNEQRVARVRAEMQAHGLTQMIISDSKSIWYLTGASVEPYERLMALYLPVQGEPVIFFEQAVLCAAGPCREVWHTDSDKPVEQIAEVVDKTKTLGIDKEWPAKFLIPLMELCPGMPVVLASDCVDACRAVKDAEEQMLMKEASRINDETILKARDYVKPGMTEKQVAEYIDNEYKKAGCESAAFTTIVSFGANAADPPPRAGRYCAGKRRVCADRYGLLQEPLLLRYDPHILLRGSRSRSMPPSMTWCARPTKPPRR